MELVIPSAEMSAAKQKFLISTSVRRTDGVHVRIVAAERPGTGAAPATPTLEDAYLHCISNQRTSAGRMSETNSRIRILYHLARADFLERVRRYSFVLTMGISIYLGYAAATGQLEMRVGDSGAFLIPPGLAD